MLMGLSVEGPYLSIGLGTVCNYLRNGTLNNEKIDSLHATVMQLQLHQVGERLSHCQVSQPSCSCCLLSPPCHNKLPANSSLQVTDCMILCATVSWDLRRKTIAPATLWRLLRPVECLTCCRIDSVEQESLNRNVILTLNEDLYRLEIDTQLRLQHYTAFTERIGFRFVLL